MARNFSDTFSSDSNQQDTNADVNSNTDGDFNADNNTDVSNSGINLSTESYSSDEDGNESYDASSLDTGNTDLGNDLDLDGMVTNTVDGLLNSSGSSDSTDSFES